MCRQIIKIKLGIIIIIREIPRKSEVGVETVKQANDQSESRTRRIILPAEDELFSGDSAGIVEILHNNDRHRMNRQRRRTVDERSMVDMGDDEFMYH